MSGFQQRRGRQGIAPALLAVACSLSLVGCAYQSTTSHPDVRALLHDDAFPGHETVQVESRRDVFSLDDSAKRHLDRSVSSVRDYHGRGRALIDEIFEQAKLNLAYDSKANTTAAETFHERAANCLSMSILAYAMAEYTGFHATFQEVDIPEYWERRKNYSLMSQHVNLRITPEVKPGTMLVAKKVELEIDFMPVAGSYRPPSRPITQSRALAMFYNNKGVDALLDGDHETAYAYLKAAIEEDPSLGMAATNLGLLYVMRGRTDWAQANYRYAIRIAPENAIASESLAVLLRRAGQAEEADMIMARLERARENNPYFQYIQGAEAYDDGNIESAIHFFKRALKIKPDMDQFHHGLARSYAAIGEFDRADFHLRRAERNAGYEDLKEKYRAMRAALPGRSR